MKLTCKYVSASEAGDEIFQVTFEEKFDEIRSPYLLIQRAWLEEDGDEFSPVYVETHDTRLIDHYPSADATLTRNHFTLSLPAPVNETIEVAFSTSESNFQELKRVLKIIFQKNMKNKE